MTKEVTTVAEASITIDSLKKVDELCDYLKYAITYDCGTSDIEVLVRFKRPIVDSDTIKNIIEKGRWESKVIDT